MRYKRLPGLQAYVRELMAPEDYAQYKAMTENSDKKLAPLVDVGNEVD